MIGHAAVELLVLIASAEMTVRNVVARIEAASEFGMLDHPGNLMLRLRPHATEAGRCQKTATSLRLHDVNANSHHPLLSTTQNHGDCTCDVVTTPVRANIPIYLQSTCSAVRVHKAVHMN